MAQNSGEVDPRRRARRTFLVAVALGALAVVLVAVLGVVVLVHELEKRSVDPFSQAHTNYHRMYLACVARGEGRSKCAARASEACFNDPIFKHDFSGVSDISLVCSHLRRD